MTKCCQIVLALDLSFRSCASSQAIFELNILSKMASSGASIGSLFEFRKAYEMNGFGFGFFF